MRISVPERDLAVRRFAIRQDETVVLNRGCGATVGYNTQVSVIPSSTPLPNDSGNTLILDDAASIDVHWTSDTAMKISGLQNARVFKQEASAADVQIAYAQ